MSSPVMILFGAMALDEVRFVCVCVVACVFVCLCVCVCMCVWVPVCSVCVFTAQPRMLRGARSAHLLDVRYMQGPVCTVSDGKSKTEQKNASAFCTPALTPPLHE
jgi:hypothetical protein